MDSSTLRYVRDLGRGSFGSVVLAEDTSTNQLLAVKKIARDLASDPTLERELLLHSKLRHPHIVRFQQVFLSPRHFNVVLEYVPNGSLLDYVLSQPSKRLPEGRARWLFQQLMIAVSYLHEVGVVNRDIKLDNLLVDTSDKGRPDFPILKMCDLGYSRDDNRSDARSRVGTVSYMAPEVLRGRGSYSGRKADLWSSGVCLFAMLCGSMPYRTVSDASLAQDILGLIDDMMAQRFALPASLSNEARDLVAQLLQPDPARRITMEGVFNHPWFRAHLPDEALGMNAAYLRLPRACPQSPEAIWALINRARSGSGGCDAPGLPESPPGESGGAGWFHPAAGQAPAQAHGVQAGVQAGQQVRSAA